MRSSGLSLTLLPMSCMSRIEMMPRAGDRPRARPRASFPDLIVCPI